MRTAAMRRETPARRWIVPVAILTTLLPLIALAVAALLAALHAYRAADESRLRDTARALAAAVDAELGRYVAALETLATSPLLDSRVDGEAFEARARSVAERLGGGIVLIDSPPGYQMLANTRRQPGASLPSARHPEGQPVLETVFAEGRPGISDLFTGAVTGRQTLAVMVPVDLPGQPRRVLALAVQPSAGVRHGSMRQPAAVGITATGGQTDGPEPQRQARGGAGGRSER